VSTWQNETVMGKFEADYVFMLAFDKEGKIERVRELVEERATKHFHELLEFVQRESRRISRRL
jgi:hypothetical protein